MALRGTKCMTLFCFLLLCSSRRATTTLLTTNFFCVWPHFGYGLEELGIRFPEARQPFGGDCRLGGFSSGHLGAGGSQKSAIGIIRRLVSHKMFLFNVYLLITLLLLCYVLFERWWDYFLVGEALFRRLYPSSPFLFRLGGFL